MKSMRLKYIVLILHRKVADLCSNGRQHIIQHHYFVFQHTAERIIEMHESLLLFNLLRDEIPPSIYDRDAMPPQKLLFHPCISN